MSNAKISELTPDPNNANKGTQRGLKALDKSLRQYGAGRSILLDRDNRIIAGNKTAERALDIGLEDVQIVDSDGTKLIAVRRTDLDLEDDGGKARALATYDNRVGQLDLEWDLEALGAIDADVLGELWTDKELADLGVTFGEPPEDPGAQIDKADELRQKWGVETGQIWKLGEHRLICGDCTDKGVVDRVIEGAAIEMTFIDPPYNALKSWNKDEAHSETRLDPSKWFENDNMEWDAYWSFIEKSFMALCGHSVYVCCDYRIYAGIRAKVEQAGYEIKHCIVWKKNVLGLGKRYRFQHEFIVYACKDKAPFYGGRDQSDVWEIDIHKTTEHNTPKPPELSEKAIKNSSTNGAFVFDGFLGSGTTLIACERLGRKCRAVEISPGYVAVAIQRWADMTGGTPELISNT